MSGTSDIADVLLLMRNFGLLDISANLLVLGTSSSKVAKSLYRHLKTDLDLFVDKKPYNEKYSEFQYDFIYLSSGYNCFESISKLLKILRPGGLILAEYGDDFYNVEILALRNDMKIIKVNKKLELLKG